MKWLEIVLQAFEYPLINSLRVVSSMTEKIRLYCVGWEGIYPLDSPCRVPQGGCFSLGPHDAICLTGFVRSLTIQVGRACPPTPQWIIPVKFLTETVVLY